MSDFLADNNLCGQTLLRIVSRGNALLAQLLRLKHNIPPVFRLDNKADQLKYSELIIDLRYFSDAEAFERKVEQNAVMRDLDDELRESYTEILTEFYSLFEGIYKYVTSLSKFVDDVQEGYYIQMSLENILYNVEGRQLLIESLYLYGCMLLLLDLHFDGPVRERILTSVYRYGTQASDTNVDDVCKLLRSTKKTATYPQDYFQRFPLNDSFVQMLIGRLRSDDIYLQLNSYPLPQHRTTALAAQASVLVVILCFAPSVLHNETATMREICDKFFNDNWVIPIYMGYRLNLLDFWSGYKAAKMALDVCKSAKAIKMDALVSKVSEILKEGVLTEENVLERANKVIEVLRECNVVLRWVFLHAAPLSSDIAVTKKSRQMRDLALAEAQFNPEALLSLLLHVAQLELKLRELYRKLLAEKQLKWLELRTEAKERVQELAEVFSGNKPLTRIQKNENLCHWLETKATQIDSLDFEKLKFSGRIIIEIIRAFNEMLEFHNLESEVQIREWTTATTSCLHRMLKTGLVNEDTLVTLQIIGDLGYAWGSLIDTLTPQMQGLIKKDPFAVTKLRAVFLKLSSAMDIPLMRLSQAKSSELVSVSAYYSGELVSYVQKVLQIIPESIFSFLHQIIELQTNSVMELPTRLEKDKVKDYAQLEFRQKISRLTHNMSVLTEGILMMQTTLVGIIRIDPKTLLENGIRKELLRQLTLTMFSAFTQAQSQKTSLESKLEQIAQRIDGIRRSFEYIGDYVNSHGLKIFQEEFNRLLNFSAEQECNAWKKVKILPFQSIYQSKEVPIQLPALDDTAVTFIGKLVNELLVLTDSKTTVFVDDTTSWYDIKTHAPVLTPDTFKLIERAIDIVGLVNLDKIVSFHCVKELENTISTFQPESSANLEFLSSLHSELQPPSKVIQAANYSIWSSRFARSQSVSFLLKVGQLQLIRKRIQYQLKISANLNAKQLYSALEVANKLVSLALHDNQDVEDLACELHAHSEPHGIYDPLSKIYVTLKPIQHVPLLLALVCIQQFKKLSYAKSVASLTCRKAGDGIDGLPLVIGVSTFLTQLHSSQTLSFLSHLCQYLNALIVQLPSASMPKKDEDLAACFYFITLFLRYHPRKETEKFVRLLIPCYDILPSLISYVV